LVQFAKAGYECYGIDLTEKHFELANKNFSLRELKANLTLGDASKLPYENEFFDVVYSFGVLHHTPDIDKCIDEIYRVLKKGGETIIALYNRNSAWYLTSKLFVDGILKGWLFKLGIKGLRSTIEFGADGKNIKPLVVLYTKNKARKVFNKFNIESVSIKHLEKSHFWKSGLFVPNWIIKKLEKYLGWYVIIKAKKT
jgi:ubiquinone/menaquinone biosynthesis C-methylase UbiE